MTILYFLESIRNPVLDFLFSIITLFGDETIFMALGMIIFWCANKYHGYFLLCTCFIGTIINQFLKIVCRVPRPWVKDPNFTIVESAREAATGYSFPSGHTQTSVGLFGGFARCCSSKIIRIVAIAFCVLVPLSRMYLGVHTPLDVVVSVCIALILIFVGYPLFEKAKSSPKIMYIILLSLTAITLAYMVFVFVYPFPENIDTHNLESAHKNAATLCGCMLGLIVVYTVDEKRIRFDTNAVWWVQIIKAVGGIALVLAAKELLRAPLDVLFQGSLIARGVRYFIIVLVGGIIWPICFKYLCRLTLTKNKEKN